MTLLYVGTIIRITITTVQFAVIIQLRVRFDRAFFDPINVHVFFFFFNSFLYLHFQIWSSERGQVAFVGSRHAGAGEVQQRCSGATLRVGQRMSGLRKAAVQIRRRNMVSSENITANRSFQT